MVFLVFLEVPEMSSEVVGPGPNTREMKSLRVDPGPASTRSRRSSSCSSTSSTCSPSAPSSLNLQLCLVRRAAAAGQAARRASAEAGAEEGGAGGGDAASGGRRRQRRRLATARAALRGCGDRSRRLHERPPVGPRGSGGRGGVGSSAAAVGSPPHPAGPSLRTKPVCQISPSPPSRGALHQLSRS